MKKGSKRQSGVERHKNYFEDLTTSKEFLRFAKQMRKEHDKLSLHEFYNPRNVDELNEYFNSFVPWEEKIKKYCQQHGLDPSEFYPLVSIIIRHGKQDWLTVTHQEMIQMTEDDSSDVCFPITLKISPYASRNNILEFIERNYTSNIEPIQKKFRKNIDMIKVRSKRTKKRDDTICKLSFEGKKPNEIAIIVNDKFTGVVGYEDINRILRKKDRQ